MIDHDLQSTPAALPMKCFPRAMVVLALDCTLLLVAGVAEASERCRPPNVAPADYGYCLERLPARDRPRLIAIMGQQREKRARELAIAVLSARVLRVGQAERRTVLAALVQLGQLSVGLVRNVPNARRLVRMIRTHLRRRPGEKPRGHFTGVDCLTVGRAAKTLRCGPTVLERITARTCRLLPSPGRTLAISCSPRWCRPCRRVGIDLTLRRQNKGPWRVETAIPPHLPPHGCGFGCEDGP